MTFQVAVEKSTAKTKAIQTKKINSRLMKGKKDIFIAAFNVQTLQKEGKIPELVTTTDSTKHEIICLQEHRFIHEGFATKEYIFGSCRLITCSAWKNVWMWLLTQEELECYLAHKPTMLLSVLK